MPAMNMEVPAARDAAQGGATGLPRVNYYPPIVATLLAAVFVFIIALALGVVMVGNTVRQLDRSGSDASGTAALTAGICGLASLLFLGCAVYLLTAIIKGVRDLSAPLQYTRGTVVDQQMLAVRKVRNWLLVDPAYSGPDQERARAVTDEQIAASVDRAQIVQTRPGGGFWRSRRKETVGGGGLQEDLARAESKPAGYLSPERISASTETPRTEPTTESSDAVGTPRPHVIFRSDFASQAQLHAGEEVIVAHSRYLEHPFYIARLINGEWQVHRNKALL